MRPLVSIIMNCHNSQIYLEEAIDSIYNQTYKNWEIIFWDNCSTDDSAKIAKSYDDKLKYFYSDEFTVLGKARNLALSKVSGKYVGFLDCDDLWLPNKLEKQIELIEYQSKKNDVGFIYGRTNYYFQNQNNNYIKYEKSLLPEGQIFEKLVKENFISFVSALCSREKLLEIGGFPENFKHSTDYWIFIKLAEKYNVCALQEVCCTYRVHNNNLSNKQYLIAAKEAVEVFKSLNHGASKIIGLKHAYTLMSFGYFKEYKILKGICLIISKNLILIIVEKLLMKALNRPSYIN